MAEINILELSDVERDAGLETSILISLFTDKRAELEDALPDNSKDRRGWWADTSEDQIGSKLWLLSRSATLTNIQSSVEQYVKESLQWMVVDGVAQTINVTALRSGQDTMLITIEIVQPDGKDKFYKYSINWEEEIIKRG